MKKTLTITRITALIGKLFGFGVLLLTVSLQFNKPQTFLMNLLLPSSVSINLNGFSGFFPFYFSFEKIEIHEKNKALLEINNITFRWSVSDLIINQDIGIEYLDIDYLRYHEIIFQNSNNFNDFKLPKIPFIKVSSLNVKKFDYITKDKTFKYSLSGNTLKNKPDQFKGQFILKNLEQDINTVNLEFSYTQLLDDHLNIKLDALDDKGILSYLLSSPNDKLKMKLVGQGNFNNFQGSLEFQSNTVKISSSISTSKSLKTDHIDLTIQGSYSDKHNSFKGFGSIQTDPTLTSFKVNDYQFIKNTDNYLTLKGNIQRNGYIFHSKDFNIYTVFLKEYAINSCANFQYNPFTCSIKSKLKNELFWKNKKILNLEIPISCDGTLESFSVLLKGDLDIPGLPETYKSYSKLNLFAELTPKSLLSIPKIQIKLEGLKNKAEGILSLGRSLNLNLKGNIDSNIFQLKGLMKDDTGYLQINNRPVANQDFTISNLKIRLTPEKKFKIDTKVDLILNGKEIQISSNMAIDKDFKHLNLLSFEARHKESFIESSGFLDFNSEQGNVKWHIYTFNINDFLKDENSTSGTLSIMGNLNVSPKTWLLNFSGEFHKLFFLNHIFVKSGKLDGSIDLKHHKDLYLNLTGQNMLINHTVIENFSLNTQGHLNEIDNKIAMNGFSEQDIQAKINFSIKNLSEFNLQKADLKFGNYMMFLDHPATLHYQHHQWDLNKLNFKVNNGNVSIKGKGNQSDIYLNADIHQLPSQLIYHLTHGSYFLKGLINGNLEMKGHLSSPIVNIDLNTSDNLYSTKISGTFINGSLKTNARIYNNQLNLELKGTYPIDFSIAPFKFNLNHSKPLYTNIVAKGIMDDIQKIFPLNYDKVGGNVDANISLYGTMDQRNSKGYINVENGTYERQNIGLKLKDINFHLIAKDGYFILENPVEFTDNQKNKGTIIFAKLGLGKFLIPYLDTEIKFKDVDFINLPQTMRSGTFAAVSGTLKATGPVNALSIYVRGDVSSLEKYIGETEDIPIYKVNLFHKNLPLKFSENSSKSASIMKYDINLGLNRKFHIFGQGLDSNWTGRLIIQGTSEKPVYKGKFNLQQGQLRVLDKFFDVQKGEIAFDGDLSPKLYIESDLKLPGMYVKIILEGDSTNLQTKIISDQNLSEQEILQKLFFNSSSALNQSFQALNYLAASSMISSFINIGFYQEEDPINHNQKEFISIQKRFSQKTYGKINVNVNNTTASSTNTNVSIAAGYEPTKQTKTEVTFSPDKQSLGIKGEWNIDF